MPPRHPKIVDSGRQYHKAERYFASRILDPANSIPTKFDLVINTAKALGLRAVQRYRLSPKGNSGQQFEVAAKNGDSSGRKILNL